MQYCTGHKLSNKQSRLEIMCLGVFKGLCYQKTDSSRLKAQKESLSYPSQSMWRLRNSSIMGIVKMILSLASRAGGALGVGELDDIEQGKRI